MALPYYADFTGTDTDDLATANSDFTQVLGSILIDSNSYHPATFAAPASYRLNSESFNDDQYAQIELVATADLFIWVGVSLRNQSAAATYYAYNVSSAASTDNYLVEVTGGSQTVLEAVDNDVWVATDILRLEIEGTTITPLRNGSTPSGMSATTTDASITSGDAGVAGYGTSTAVRGDNGEFGNIGAAGGRIMGSLAGLGGLGGPGGLAGTGGGLAG